MIKKGIRQATIMGGVLTLVFVAILGLILGFILLPAGFVLGDFIMVLVLLVIVGLIAGLISTYIIMSGLMKQFMPLIESLMGTPSKKK